MMREMVTATDDEDVSEFGSETTLDESAKGLAMCIDFIAAQVRQTKGSEGVKYSGPSCQERQRKGLGFGPVAALSNVMLS